MVQRLQDGSWRAEMYDRDRVGNGAWTPSPSPAKPVVTHVVPRVPQDGHRVGRRRSFWRLVRRDLAHRLNLVLVCPDSQEARMVARELKRIQRRMGAGFLVAQRGSAVFASHFTEERPRSVHW